MTPTNRRAPKEYRGTVGKSKVSYGDKLRDVRWKRRRDEVIRERRYTCCECCSPLTEGTMDLQVHHVVYIAHLDPWDYPDELLVVVCDWHHKERQAVELAIYVEIGKHLATLVFHQTRPPAIYTFFEDDSTLDYLPLGLRELLRYEHSKD